VSSRGSRVTGQLTDGSCGSRVSARTVLPIHPTFDLCLILLSGTPVSGHVVIQQAYCRPKLTSERLRPMQVSSFSPPGCCFLALAIHLSQKLPHRSSPNFQKTAVVDDQSVITV